MIFKRSLLTTCILLGLAGCGGSDDEGSSTDNGHQTPTEIVFPSNPSDIVFQFVPAPDRAGEYDLQITNNGDKPISPGGWRMYFPNTQVDIIDEQFESLDAVSKTGIAWAPSSSFQPIGVGQTVRYKVMISVMAKGRVVQDQGAPYFSSIATDGFETVLGSATVKPTDNMMPFVSPGPIMFFPTPREPSTLYDLRYQFSDVAYDRVMSTRLKDIGSAFLPTEPETTAVGKVNQKFIPFPKEVIQGVGNLDLTDATFMINTSQSNGTDLSFEKTSLEKILEQWGYDEGSATPVTINLVVSPTAFDDTIDRAGSYKLNVGRTIDITGKDEAGVYYGIQSLSRLLYSARDTRKMPKLEVKDGPSLDDRVFLLDTVRHFTQVDKIKQMIDVISTLKMNVFTLGVNNDGAWRLEIPSIPEMAQIGGKTGHEYANSADPETNLSRKPQEKTTVFNTEPVLPPYLYNGPETRHEYYSKAQIVELIKYAAERHVYFNLEINSIGHSGALVDIMEFTDYQITDPEDMSPIGNFQGAPRLGAVNPCMPDTYVFWRTVFGDVKGMYDEAGVKMKSINLGGDEVPTYTNTSSPACERLGILQMKDMPDDGSGLINEIEFRKKIQTQVQTRHYTEIKAAAQEVLGGDVMLQFWNDIAGHIDPAAIDQAKTEFWMWGPISKGNPDASGWHNQRSALTSGARVAMAAGGISYFDMPTVAHESEYGLVSMNYLTERRVYSANPFSDYEYGLGGQFADAAKNVNSMVAALWHETVLTEQAKDRLMFPRMLPFADHAWNWGENRVSEIENPELGRTYTHFNQIMREVELPLLHAAGIDYRVDLAGAKAGENGVSATNMYGDDIYYTVDGSIPAVDVVEDDNGVITVTPQGSTTACKPQAREDGTTTPTGLNICEGLSNISSAKFIAVDKSGHYSAVTVSK